MYYPTQCEKGKEGNNAIIVILGCEAIKFLIPIDGRHRKASQVLIRGPFI